MILFVPGYLNYDDVEFKNLLELKGVILVMIKYMIIQFLMMLQGGLNIVWRNNTQVSIYKL
jgi:hypothetical protein